MLRKNSSFGSRRLLGIIYIAGQLLGGIIAAIVSIFLAEGNDNEEDNLHFVARPIVDSEGKEKGFSAFISEIVGTFIFVFIFMLCTDKKTQFSNDRVINCFIIASSYISARLMAGGTLVTGRRKHQISDTVISYIKTGPVLNPALAFG